MLKFVNLTGQQIGEWVVLGIVPIDKRPYRGRPLMYFCRCSCGKEKMVLARALGRSSLSCGHHIRKDITGQKFGRLTVLERVGIKYSNTYWRCCCDCGNIREVSSYDIRYGITISCGCYNREQTSNRMRKLKSKYYEEISGQFWGIVRTEALERNLEFNITREEVWNLYIEQNRKCVLSKIDIVFGKEKNRTASIDRIDNRLGYTIDNVQILHKRVNFMKNNMEQEEFIWWCHQIGNNSLLSEDYCINHTTLSKSNR